MSRAMEGSMPAGATRIWRVAGGDAAETAPTRESRREHLLGYLDEAGAIYRLRLDEGRQVGVATDEGHILRQTEHGLRDLGHVDRTGAIYSVGLLEGGVAGWMEPDGVVLRGGGLFSEIEVGRVEGVRALEAAAALILIFLPDEDESNRRSARQA